MKIVKWIILLNLVLLFFFISIFLYGDLRKLPPEVTRTEKVFHELKGVLKDTKETFIDILFRIKSNLGVAIKPIPRLTSFNLVVNQKNGLKFRNQLDLSIKTKWLDGLLMLDSSSYKVKFRSKGDRWIHRVSNKPSIRLKVIESNRVLPKSFDLQ